ncbi:MAG: BMP family ABC transporter substrate-binding protein [Clostridia bacterium]|nr:BMP family ABC transporter substrate-binding protein [Clostridia bacterium]
MSKKILAILLVALMALSAVALASCNGTTTTETKIKAGFIYLHDENSTYDKNFMNGAKEACEALGIEYLERANIPEGNECYETALDLIDQGCTVIFADSFGHEDYMIKAAKEHPEVQFCHATGTKAHTENLANYHNAFAAIYEGRFLAGVAAGMKLQEMINAGQFTAEEAKIGYVGAFTYAEVISGYTSFFLGVRSIVPTVTMEVQFTGSWYDEAAEKEAAQILISHDCKLISQHADSMGAPSACETAGIPNVSYNGSTVAQCPNTFIVSSRIDWAPYYKYVFGQMKEGKAIDTDWTGTLATGSVVLTDINEKAAAAGTAEKIAEVRAALEAGTLNVFAADTFTKDGAKLDSYMADVDTDPEYTPDKEVIEDGAFRESKYRSAPYFDIQIDGITLLNVAF